MNHSAILELEAHSHPDTSLGFDLVLFEVGAEYILYAFAEDPILELENIVDGYYYIGSYKNNDELKRAIAKLERELSEKYKRIVLVTGQYEDIQAVRDLLLQSGKKTLHVCGNGNSWTLSGRAMYLPLIKGMG